MVTSYSTCQKEEKECIWVKYLIYAVLPQFKICRNLRIFSAKSEFPKFQGSRKNIFFPSLGKLLRTQSPVISCLLIQALKTCWFTNIGRKLAATTHQNTIDKINQSQQTQHWSETPKTHKRLFFDVNEIAFLQEGRSPDIYTAKKIITLYVNITLGKSIIGENV